MFDCVPTHEFIFNPIKPFVLMLVCVRLSLCLLINIKHKLYMFGPHFRSGLQNPHKSHPRVAFLTTKRPKIKYDISRLCSCVRWKMPPGSTVISRTFTLDAPKWNEKYLQSPHSNWRANNIINKLLYILLKEIQFKYLKRGKKLKSHNLSSDLSSLLSSQCY